MANSRLRAAILIVSDTASQDPRTDKCAPVLREKFTKAADQWEIAVTHIMADEKDAIQTFVKKWTDEDNWANCIVTSGGTGFAIRDQTPEVCIAYKCISTLLTLKGCH
jgi:gephyrin